MNAPAFDYTGFAAALLDPALPPPCGLPETRFAIYRNNVVFGLIEALGARFPVCRRLLGEECFDASAALFARRKPPRAAVLHEYGEGFAEFLEAFPPFADYDYLGDMARFEAALGRAYYARHARPLAPAALASLEPATLAGATLALHPSLKSSAQNAPSCRSGARIRAKESRRSHRSSGRTSLDPAPRSRCRDASSTRRGTRLLTALLEENTVGEAIARALESDAGFDLAAILSLLFSSRAIIAIGETL